MNRAPTNREYLLGGLFALLAAFPIVTATDLSVPLHGSVAQEAIERAFRDRDDQSILRRMRWSILRDCAQREALGEKDACPDMNDVDALLDYWTPAVREAAPAEEAISASMDDLGEYERNVLRRAKRVGQCLTGLDDLVPGFQELCESEIAKGSARIDAIKEAADRWVGAPRVRR